MKGSKSETINSENTGETSNIIDFSWNLNEEGSKINMSKEKSFQEIVETFSSMSIKPQLNIRVGEKEYEIKVGTRYKRNWKEDIDRAIKSKIGEKKLIEEQVDDVRDFLLSPFQMSDKYGEEVLRYYIGNVLKCIENEDIIQQYLMKKLNELRQNLKKLKDKIGEIMDENEDNNVDGGEEKGEKEEREKGFVWNNVDKLKMVSFIHYLEKKADLSEDYKMVINKYREILIGGSSGNFDKRVRIEPSFITDKRFKTKEQRVSISTSISEEDFVSICKNVSEFLGKKLDVEKERDLRELFEDIKKGVYARESIDSFKNNKLLEFLQKKKLKYKVEGNDLKVYIDGKLINGQSKSNPTSELKNLLKKYISDDRPDNIGKILKNVFGIDFVLSDGERMNCGRKDDCDLLVFMLETLINKINKDKEVKNKSMNEGIEAIKYERLQEMCLDSNLSKQLELILRQIIDSGITDCIDAIELLSRDVGQLEKNLQDLEKCVRGEGNIEENVDIRAIEGSLKAKKEDFDKLDELFKWCKNGRNGEYDMNVLKGLNISMGKKLNVWGTIQLKKLIFLKKLFESDKLKLVDKFYYSEIILSIKSDKDRIECEDWGHDEILKDLFGDNDVDVNYDIKELKDVGGDLISSIEFDGTESVDEKYIKHWLKEKEFTTYRANEVVGLAILKANLVNRFLDLKKIDFDYEYDLKNSDGEEKEIYEKMKSEEKEEIKKNSEIKFDTDFEFFLRILGVSDEGVEELNKLNSLFPGALESYLKGCLSVGALKFGDSNAIDYKEGSLDFSIIQAGILEKAVEDGKGLKVLEYLGFFLKEESLGKIAEQGINNPAFINQVKQFIKYLRSLKQGCFSEKYLGHQKSSHGNEWRKLDFKEGNDFLRKKTTPNKFGIGKSGQDFRLVGINNHGFYCILKCFVDEHDTYEDYLGKKVSGDEKKLFEGMTGKSW